MYQSPRQPNQPPGIIPHQHSPAARRSGFQLERIFRTIKDRPWRSFSLVAAVAVGVTLSIAIIGAGDGVQQAVNNFMGPGLNNIDLSQPTCPQPGGLDPCTIQHILTNTQSLLVRLAIIFTASLVALISWITMGQRKREISIRISNGERTGVVAGELVVEALILCTVGGVIGVLVGAFVCNTLSSALNPLTLPFHIADVQWLFPTTTLLSFGATSVVAVYYASKPDTGTQY